MPRIRVTPSELSAIFDAIGQLPDVPAVTEGDDWVEDIAAENQDLAGEKARKERQKNDERFRYAKIFVRLSTYWLGFIALVIVSHGLDFIPFSLSDTILGILLGTTTLNVLGPYFWIAKYLFNGKGGKR
ncbi:MAG: hypothetical protein OXD43_13320 [Bacteroidetes bacterium]|nr:hypothetical protein [Bacteroidota bacterium]